jgi:hypothetical protein
MEPEDSLPRWQVPATCPELNQTNRVCAPPPTNPTSWRSILIISSHLFLGNQSGLFLSGFPTNTLYASLLSTILATCTTQLIVLDLITLKIFDEPYRSLSSTDHAVLHYVV